MAYTTPTNASVGQILTAARWNQEVRDNLRYLKGEDGPIELSSPILVPGGGYLSTVKNTSGTSALFGVQDDTGANRMYLGYMTNSYITADQRNHVVLGAFNSDLVFAIGSSSHMRLTQSGNVGIGTAAPTQKFYVDGSAAITGSIGIGMTAPYAGRPLSVTGNGYLSGALELGSSMGIAWNISNLGTHKLVVGGTAGKTDGTTTWAVVSDARTKQVRGAYTKGLAAIRQIQPIRYRYNGRFGLDAQGEHIGLVAQRIEKIFPEAVSRMTMRERDTVYHDFRVINIDAIIYTMINAIKEIADHVGMP